MQNAIIKYKIRLEKSPHEGKEIELPVILSDIEFDDSLADKIMDEWYPTGTWAGNYYTVIERTIEPFNED